MMNVVKIALAVICNFILYLSFGSLLTRRYVRKNGDGSCPVLISVVTGFFFYYFVFFIFCIPPMRYFRPLSLLTRIWVPTAVIIVLISAVLNGRDWLEGFRRIGRYIKGHPAAMIILAVIVGIQVVLVSCTYNFTLDAAYYVANVATSVQTDMMNVYDPFTGAWQDHYEMRYFFATYSIQDSVVCQLTGIPALIWTKSVMAVTIILLTNMVCFMIARELIVYKNGRNEKESSGEGDRKGIIADSEITVVIMMGLIFLVNMMFTTIYTSSLFLMTRTYEGKAIVGNLALLTVFLLFIRMNDESLKIRPWLMVFMVCFGAATISSSANMLLPVELTVLFVPMIVRKKKWGMIPKYIACVIPGLVFSAAFVLYVKGYFVLYTFPK